MSDILPYLKDFFGFGPPMAEEDIRVRQLLGHRDSMQVGDINKLNNLGFGYNVWQELARRDGYVRQLPTVSEVISLSRSMHKLLLDTPTLDKMNMGLSPNESLTVRKL